MFLLLSRLSQYEILTHAAAVVEHCIILLYIILNVYTDSALGASHFWHTSRRQ